MEKEAELKKKSNEDSADLRRRSAAVKPPGPETKNSLQTMQASEIRYRRLFETAQDGILILNAETGEIDDVNPFMIDMLHYSREEFLGMKLWEVSPFKDTRFNRAAFDELQEKGYIRYKDLPLETKEGKPVAVEFISNVYKADGNKVIQCNIRNVTDRVEVNRKLQEAVIFQQRLIDALPVPVFYKDSEGRYLGCNSSFENFFGRKKEQVIGRSVYDIAPKDLADIYYEKDQALLQNPGVEIYESIVKDAGGIAHNVIFHKATFPGRDGSVGGLIGAILDITDYKRSAEALLIKTMLLEAQSETSLDGILAVDNEGRIILFNKRFCELWKIPRRVLETKNDVRMLEYILKRLKDPDEFERTVAYLHKHKDKKSRDEVEFADGSWLDRYSSSLIGTDGQYLGRIWFFRDITERKLADAEKEKLQARLIQSQKMEAIGTLAGGIAHDFNNILSAVIGYTELAQMKLESDSEIKNDLKEVLTAGVRAKDLVRQILSFSRQTKEEKLPVQVGLITKEALKLIRASLPATIEIRQNILSKSVVLSDPIQIHQIVMNLCTNAAHAMQAKGGILEVTLADVALDSDFCSTHPEIQPGVYQKLMVSDTGCGMTAEIRKRIFDPFFTTKPKDQGTGLGLSVVHGIVKDCGGTSTVYSEPDKGTTFNLYFPVITDRTEDKSEEHAVFPTGTERILVVDDEKAIIDITQKILSSLGYAVEVRTSSIEALAFFRATPSKFDLVITDMTMPQMTGDALARELMKIRPDLPVILCTGFSENITKEKAETIGIKTFLMKPLLKKEMAHTIRRVLDE